MSMRSHMQFCEEYMAHSRWRCGNCEMRTKIGDEYPDESCNYCGADAWYAKEDPPIQERGPDGRFC